MLKLIVAVALLSLGASSGCGRQNSPTARAEAKREQVLPLTFGGFLKDGPEAEKVGGVCRPNDRRSLLDCDIYNGLSGWTITGVTLFLSWSPYEGDDSRYYEVRAVIKPRTAEHVSVRLGLGSRWVRTSHWSWLIFGAKGYPTK
jgi:hypothetical protein